MRPIFANSAFIGVPERLVLRGGGWSKIKLRVRYGLLVHPKAGPVLIDTGYGPEIRHRGLEGGLLHAYHRALRAKLQPEQMAQQLLAAHGFTPKDVGTIIVTHFHADHVAQLSLFPSARFIVRDSAWNSLKSGSLLHKMRHSSFSCLIPDDFGQRVTDIERLGKNQAPLGLGGGWDLFGDGSVLGIDLPGHANGHFGVCFARLEPALLYAVDVQWHRKAIAEDRPPGFPASLIAHDRNAALNSIRKVQGFLKNGGEVVLCHDPSPSPYDYDPGKQANG